VGTEVVTWSLEMTDRAALRPAREPSDPPLLVPAGRPAPELARFFYSLVGAGWGWTDRLAWSDAEWTAWVDRPELHLVTAWSDGGPAGYYELEQQSDGGPSGGASGSVELAYFGLAPATIGRGWGGWLLGRALTHAWDLPGTRRVWVHTCSLDHPRALATYQARGLVRFAQTRQVRG
jgi:GNAT superfamily N-acetyltransferase